MKKIPIPSVEVSFCFYVQYITNTFSPELSRDSDAPSHQYKQRFGDEATRLVQPIVSVLLA